jgi:hypothetical protein
MVLGALCESYHSCINCLGVDIFHAVDWMTSQHYLDDEDIVGNVMMSLIKTFSIDGITGFTLT